MQAAFTFSFYPMNTLRHCVFSFLFAVFCLLPFAFSGCKSMPNDGIPVYMKMDSAKAVTSSGQQLPQNITTVWDEANSDNVGAYELPCNIPVLQENDIRFVVSA